MRKLTETVEGKYMVRVYRDREWDEYVVRLYRLCGGLWARIDDAEYRTTDRLDALATSQAMFSKSIDHYRDIG